MRRLLALLVMIAVATGSGCGREEEDARNSREAVPRGTTTDEMAPMEAEPGAGMRQDLRPSGREIFIEAGCGNCHTLEAAGTTGTVGPNLDEHLAHDHRGVRHIAMQVRHGGGGMPSFRGTLSDEEIARVARFVHRAARR